MKTINEQGIIELYKIVKEDLAYKVDKETGKILSSNDYTTLDKEKLASLQNYSHPIFKAAAEGLYKIAVNGEGHITITAAVNKDDIVGLGIPAQDTKYTAVTELKDGLMVAADKSKLDNIDDNANNYSHPNYTAFAAGLNKISSDGKGHVTEATPITKADIVGLGVPAQDTTYDKATNLKDGLFSKEEKIKLEKVEEEANKYIHPTQEAITPSLSKVSVNTLGHVQAVTPVTKSDIVGLGIPEVNTTYADATPDKSGLLSKEDKVKLNAIENEANKYEHPTHAPVAAGFNKLTTDTSGHTVSATPVVKADVVALGIPAQDTTYSIATTLQDGLQSKEDKTKLDTIQTGANKYVHPGVGIGDGSKALWNFGWDYEGHIIEASRIKKADIVALGIPEQDTTYTNVTTLKDGLQSKEDKVKLDGIQENANNYAHPSHTAFAAGLNKVITDNKGHVTAVTPITKTDITALGIPAQDTKYSTVTTTTDGLMAKEDKIKLNAISASAQANVLEKVSVNGIAQAITNKEINLKMPTKVSELTNDSKYTSETVVDNKITTAIGEIILFDVVKVDVLPDTGKQNTIYLVPKTVTLPEISDSCDEFMFIEGAWEKIGNTQVDLTDYYTIAEVTEKLNEKASKNHTHNVATANSLGFMASADKIKLDGIETGAEVNTITGVKGDKEASYRTGSVSIRATDVGAAEEVHIHTNATGTIDGFLSKTDKTKLDGIEIAANKYIHPSYSARATNLYKTSVDSQGHVNAVAIATKADITKLGIPAQDTTYTSVTDTVDGLMTATQKLKLDAIESSANNYSHPSIENSGKIEALYKIGYNDEGHIIKSTPVVKDDITALGVPASDTKYNAVTTTTDGLMISADKVKLNAIAAGANKYTHPSYTAKTNGLYKVTVDASGHVNATTAATKADIVGLGVPAQDTTYSDVTTTVSGLMPAADKVKLNGIAAGANKYAHPTYTTKANGLYKVTVDSTGHVSATVAAAKADIVALGIPAQDTTYVNATTAASGLMANTDKTKLDGIATGANKYVHPSYTAKTSGLYNITVDEVGHISNAIAVTKADITALGIPAQDTTYGLATASANGLMRATDKAKLDKMNTPTSWSTTLKTGGWVASGGMYYQNITLAGMTAAYEPSVILQTSSTVATKKLQLDNWFVNEIETLAGSIKAWALQKPAVDLPIKLVL